MSNVASIRQHGLRGWQAAEARVDALVGAHGNPLRHLGAVAMLAFWLCAVTGVMLYVVFDTSVAAAHASIDRLDAVPLGLGRLLRGVHRYAADLMVVAMLLHLVREWLAGHERSFRRYSWWTGVVLIGFVFLAAIGGFWLNWDQLGQYSAIATAEWIDALPVTPFATPFARNFLDGAVEDRLFSLFVFVHIGVPLLLLFGLWFHVQRISRAEIWPPRPVAWGLCVALAVLALTLPVRSHGPASLATVPQALRLDWMLLFVHPLVDATSPAAVWALAGAAALVLFGLPLLPTRSAAVREPVAVVDQANCNGCRRCVADCPYAAITMVPHPNQRIGRSLAVVDADLCASCGICAGACPSSTPFRADANLVTGIDMPQLTVDDLRRRLQHSLEACTAARPLVVFGCRHGARVEALAPADDVCTFGLLCTGQLPPSFVEYALRDGAAGVLVAACREGGCEFRLGERWTRERLSGEREPHLRTHVSAARHEVVFVGAGEETTLAAALQRLRQRVLPLEPEADVRRRRHDA